VAREKQHCSFNNLATQLTLEDDEKFEVLSEVLMKIQVFWVVTPC